MAYVVTSPLPPQVPRVDQGPRPHQLRQVAHGDHAVPRAVGGGLRAVRDGAAGQPRVRPPLRGLRLEQGGAHHGAGRPGNARNARNANHDRPRSVVLQANA